MGIYYSYWSHSLNCRPKNLCCKMLTIKIGSCKLSPKDGIDWERMALHRIASKSKSSVPSLLNILVP